MSNQKRDKDGKYTFSAGSGATNIPTAQSAGTPVDTAAPTAPVTDYTVMHQVLQDRNIDPRDIGLRERTNGTVHGTRDMSGRIAVGDIAVGDTVKGDDGKPVRVVKVSGGWVKNVTVEDVDGTTRQVRMNDAGSVELVSAAAKPAAPQVDALGIQRAAEDAGVYYDETYDGVAIGNFTVEATVNGASVYEWHGQGPEATQKLVAHYKDAESAVNDVMNF